jgi:hypothetical protein
VSSKYMMSINMVGPNLILSTPSSPIFTQLTLLKNYKSLQVLVLQCMSSSNYL